MTFSVKETMYFLAAGAVLGLSAGFAPGPLFALLISETLKHGIASGIRIAVVPLITDLPIIAVTLIVLSKLSAFHEALGVIALAGGCFLLIMGCDSMRARDVGLDVKNEGGGSLAKGVLANALNPHPYLFWFSVGAPMITKAMSRNSLAGAAAFIAGFYMFIVGSKIFLAVLVGKSRAFLIGPFRGWTMRLLGAALLVLALLLFRDGLKLLGMID